MLADCQPLKHFVYLVAEIDNGVTIMGQGKRNRERNIINGRFVPYDGRDIVFVDNSQISKSYSAINILPPECVAADIGFHNNTEGVMSATIYKGFGSTNPTFWMDTALGCAYYPGKQMFGGQVMKEWVLVVNGKNGGEMQLCYACRGMPRSECITDAVLKVIAAIPELCDEFPKGLNADGRFAIEVSPFPTNRPGCHNGFGYSKNIKL